MRCECGHPSDDHGSDGSCISCPCIVSPVRGYTVTLWAYGNGHPMPLEMPSVTTIGRAAQRVAEAFGMDPYKEAYGLVEMYTGRTLDAEELVAKYDGVAIRLVASR